MKALKLVLALWIAAPAIAQRLPKLGEIDLITMQASPLDKNAVAEVLLDDCETYFDSDRDNFFLTKTIRRKRIRIISNKGLSYANHRIRYTAVGQYEEISKIVGYTYNVVDGKIEISELDKKQIFTQKINSNVSQISFSLPNVKVGSVIEYKYIQEKKDFSKIDNWYFQREIPTLKSHFVLEIPEYFIFRTKMLTTKASTKSEKTDSRNGNFGSNVVTYQVTIYDYTMDSIMALTEEPFMSSVNDYLQRIEFELNAIITPTKTYSYSATWEDLSKDLLEKNVFGEQIDKNVKIPELDNAVKAAKTKMEKIQIMYNYFKRRYSWDMVEDFYCMDVKEIAANKKGSVGDINLLFLNKLKDYKIEAYPLLASTRDHGLINKSFPFLKQFNAVFCYIPLDKENFLVINAADKYNMHQIIPYNVINTEALLVSKREPKFVQLSNPNLIEKNIISYSCQIEKDGVVKGSCLINSNGYAKPPRLEKLNVSKQNLIDNYYRFEDPMEIKNLELQNEQNDSLDLAQKFGFEYKLPPNDDYYFFDYNLFSQLKKNPFTSETRYSDIEFNFMSSTTVNASITFPDNVEVDGLPKNVRLIMPDTGITFERRLIQDDNSIAIQVKLDIIKPYYMASDYNFVKEFFAQVYALLEEPILLKKKK
jgi:hypothetical protein